MGIALHGPIKLNNVVYGGIVSAELDFAIKWLRPRGDGELYERMALFLSQAPAIRFTSLDVSRFLALNSSRFVVAGLALASGGCVAWTRGATADGGVATTGDQFSIANGIALPQRVVNRQDAESTIEVLVVGRGADKTTNPLARVATQTVGTPAAAAIPYTLGPVGFNSNATPHPNVQAWSLICNWLMRGPLGGDGQPFPDHVGINGVSHEFEIETNDDALIGSLGVAGLRQVATPNFTNLYMRKVDVAGTRVAPATAEHIMMTVKGLNSPMFVESLRTGQDQEAGIRARYAPVWDGTNDPVVVSTSSAVGV